MSDGFGVGIVVQRAERYHRNSSAGVEARHLRSTGFTKHLHEIFRIGHFVIRQVIFTLYKLDTIYRRKPIGRVSRGTGLSASMAVTILHQLKGLAYMKFHSSTHAAATNDTLRFGLEWFLFHTLHPGKLGVVVVPGQVAGNVVPGRAMCCEDMAVRFLAVVVTPARGKPMTPLLAGVRHHRATIAAKAAGQQMR